jgi:hypothetical protein
MQVSKGKALKGQTGLLYGLAEYRCAAKVIITGKVMGLTLENERGRRLYVTEQQWRNILRTARRYGWKPMGTQPSIDYLQKRTKNPDGGYDAEMLDELIKNWNGSYLTGESQVVTYADALNISFALEEAVKRGEHKNSDIDDMISFCKMGGFSLQ